MTSKKQDFWLICPQGCDGLAPHPGLFSTLRPQPLGKALDPP